MLVNTRPDVRGEGLRLLFPSFTLAFTDRATLELGEALMRRDQDSQVRGLPLRSLGVCVTRVAADEGAFGIHSSVLAGAGTDRRPWILTRDLAGVRAA